MDKKDGKKKKKFYNLKQLRKDAKSRYATASSIGETATKKGK